MDCEIIYIEKMDENNNPVFKVVDSFKCESHQEAAMRIEIYNELHDDRTYYYRMKDIYGILHEDGTTSLFSRLDDNIWNPDYDVIEKFIHWIAPLKKQYKELKKEGKDTRKVVKKIARLRRMSNSTLFKSPIKFWIWLADNLEWYCWEKWKNKFNDWKHERKRIKYFKKHHHDLHEPWSLDTHMLSDLKWNLIRLKNESHGIPTQFIAEAMNELHSSEPDWNFEKWYVKNNCNDEEEKLAIKKMNDVYDRIIHLIDLYGFYSFMDIDDCQFPEKEDPAEKILLPGTYDIIDYKKMSEKANECYYEIWELVKKYGRSMWD